MKKSFKAITFVILLCMLLSMFVASLLFFVIYLSGRATYGNHALWGAFIVYLFSRGAVQTLLAPKVLRVMR